MAKKLTYDFVVSQFAKEGYTILSKEYINSRSSLVYKCPNGHVYSVSWNKWQYGRRCPYCTFGGRVRIKDINNIRKEFEKEGYILLTNIYIDCNQKLKYICPNGHKYATSWNDWSSKGNRCALCSKNAKLTLEFIKNEFAKDGFTLLNKEYINAKQPLRYLCPVGHVGEILWLNWYKGNRCLQCSGKQTQTIEIIRDSFNKEGYQLLTNVYVNGKQKLYFICPNKHKHYISWNNWQQGQRCGKCYSRVSKWENEVKTFINKLGFVCKPNDRTKLINPNTNMPLELDIWIPDLKKAIECNGVYWHEVRKNECDLIKLDLCKRKGIDLLVLTDLEWNRSKHATKNKIKKFLSSTNNN